MTFDPDAVHTLLHPTAIAVVGASDSSPWARAMVGNLRRFAFPGGVHMVNPYRSSVLDQPTYGTVAEAPEGIDHALVLTPAHTLLDILEDCRASGVRAVTVVASGFQESGREGRRLSAQVRDFCDTHRIALVGPNCYGFANFAARTLLTRNSFDGVREPEPIAMAFQSGGLNLAACNAAYARGVGLTLSVSSGNELVVDTNDYYDYFLTRDDVRVIGGTLERIPSPERFADIATRAADLGKPIVILKLGRSSAMQQLAVAHTGAIAGADVVVETYLRDLGVIRVDSIDELVDTAALLARSGWPRSRRTAFVGFTGGVCGLFADLAGPAGVELSPMPDELQAGLSAMTGLSAEAIQNPFDATTEGAPHLAGILDQLATSGHYDTVLLNLDPPRNDEEVTRFAPMIDALRGVSDRSSVAAFGAVLREPNDTGVLAVHGWGVHHVQGWSGAQAIGHAAAYGEWRASRAPAAAATVGDPPRSLELLDLKARCGTLSGAESRSLLEAYGVPFPACALTTSPVAAGDAADRIGYPVVLKIESPDVPHKSDAGGVILDLRDRAAVERGYEQVLAAVAAAHPHARVAGVLVSEQVTGGEEFFVGVTSDPALGPIVVVGLGGVFVELLADTASAVPPVSPEAAARLVGSLRAAPVLAGARGRSVLDEAALSAVVSRVSHLAADLRGELTGLDINPLVVLPLGRGVRALDALVVMGDEEVKDE